MSMTMRLPHGPENRKTRILMRAKALLEGIWWAKESDPTDINADEAEEIEEAEKICLAWERGEDA